MSRLAFALILIIASILQASFLPAVGILELSPNFVLVLLLIWSSNYGIEEGLIWAFFLGIWLDLLTLDPLGTQSIALMTVAVVGGSIQGRFFRSGAILPVVAVVVATITYYLTRLLLDVLSGDPVALVGSMRIVLISSLLNVLVVPLAYAGLLLSERLTPRRVS